MQNIPPIGTILKAEENRDAIHIAIAPVIAATILYPGQHIGFKEPGLASHDALEHIGIVDPYLKHAVFEGQRFFLFLYPKTVTSIRHEWTHPAFDVKSNNERVMKSKEWLDKFLEDKAYGISTEDIIKIAIGEKTNLGEGGEYTSCDNDGEYIFIGGRDAHGEIPPEFWEHIEIVSGKKIPSNKRAKAFTCSC